MNEMTFCNFGLVRWVVLNVECNETNCSFLLFQLCLFYLYSADEMQRKTTMNLGSDDFRKDENTLQRLHGWDKVGLAF